MAYRIDYQQDSSNTDTHNHLYRRRWMTVGCLILFLLLTGCFWPEGRAVLRRLLIPGNPDVTLEAAEVFARQMLDHVPLRDAIKTLWTTILSYGRPF